MIKEPELMADEVAKKVIALIERQTPVQRIRRSQAITTIAGTAGVVLLVAGMEKLFSGLSGWFSLVIGFILLLVSGTLVSKL